MSQPLEGWDVRPRPLLIALALFVVVLLALVVGCGALYKARYAERARPIVHHFGRPELETIDTAPSDETQLPAPRLPPRIAAAMAATAARRDKLWAGR